MIIEVKVPSPGESISEVQLASWLVEDGQQVEKDKDIVEIDSDKATLSIVAEEGGKIKFMAAEGDTLAVGTVVATIDTEAAGTVVEKVKLQEKAVEERQPVKAEEKVSAAFQKKAPDPEKKEVSSVVELTVSPLARKIMKQEGVSNQDLLDFFKHYRFGKDDVRFYLENRGKEVQENTSTVSSWPGGRDTEHVKMNMLRKKLAQRLVSVKNETAMLTTFNEVNMTPIMEIRKKYKEDFQKKYGVNLGFMSFFTKAVTEAIKFYPQVNAQISGDEFVHYNYVDVSIAVSAPKGLVVPVVRSAEMMSLSEIEKAIKELAVKARDNKITLEEMVGGTFTITNGGVFGSMMSTPIINPPQSAILGMHNIVERPIAVNGKVEIHPMMYVAFSYDHRIIDGRESVGFLVKVKEMLEQPERMLFEANDPIEVLLGL